MRELRLILGVLLLFRVSASAAIYLDKMVAHSNIFDNSEFSDFTSGKIVTCIICLSLNSVVCIYYVFLY